MSVNRKAESLFDEKTEADLVRYEKLFNRVNNGELFDDDEAEEFTALRDDLWERAELSVRLLANARLISVALGGDPNCLKQVNHPSDQRMLDQIGGGSGSLLAIYTAKRVSEYHGAVLHVDLSSKNRVV